MLNGKKRPFSAKEKYDFSVGGVSQRPRAALL